MNERDEPMQINPEHFTAESVADGVVAITGSIGEQIYLIEGKEKALLIDTGIGIGDLAGFIKKLTRLPLQVLNTHAHVDHAGGNSGFGEIWLNPADGGLVWDACSYQSRLENIKAIFSDTRLELKKALIKDKPYRLLPLEAGKVFDLGGRSLEVIEFPGHTEGSICLLDARNKLLFSGDSIVKTDLWLFLDHSMPLETYSIGLNEIKNRMAEFDLVFPGHLPRPINNGVIPQLLECASQVLEGKIAGEPFECFAGKGLRCKYKECSIICNDEKLFNQ